MNFLLNLINQEYLTNIYIGITGLLVAIVIFIAEIIKEQKNELYKKVLLTKTKIKNNIIFTLIVFIYMIICNMFKFDNCLQISDIVNKFFLWSHIILFISILISTFRTGKMFIVALRLNIEKDYFNEEMGKYTYKKITLLEKRANKKGKRKLKKEEMKFKNYIKSQNIYFIEKFKINNEKYEPIFPLKNGIVKSFDYKRMDELIETFKIKKINEETYNAISNNIVYIEDCIGEKVNKKQPIFYCLKQYKPIFKNINDMLVYGDNRLYIYDEIKIINDSLFELAFDFDSFDRNDRLFNYFKYLYDNQLYGVKNMALDNIEETYRKVYNDYNKNKSFSSFLNLLSTLAYSDGNYDDYKLIHNVQLYLYINRLIFPNIDIKQVAYDFATNEFRYDLFSTKKNSDIRYYDNLISILFKFIVELIKLNNYDAVNVLFDNIYIGPINYKDNDIDEYDIINFQFCAGVIYALILISNQDKIKEENINDIMKLVNYIKTNFIYIYDTWKTICVFKKYFDMTTEVQNAYKNFDFEFINHKYKSSWSGFCIDARIVLKEFIYIFNITFVNEKSVILNEINKDDKYYYQELLQIINNKENTKIDRVLKIKYNPDKLNELINIAIAEAEKKEKEFNRTNELKQYNVSQLEKLTKEKIREGTNFIKILKSYNKVQNESVELDRVFGISQLIPRDYFFNNSGNNEILAENFSNAFETGIEKEYMKKIEQISVKSEKTFEQELKLIDNLDEYFIISNYLNNTFFYKYEYNYEDDTIIFNKKRIKIIYIPQMDGAVLIKRENLPIIKLCNFSDKWNKKNIDQSIYYEFIDCSKDDALRRELIDNVDWLKEKGSNLEQDNYLKENCRIRIYLAYEIYSNKEINAIKFEIKT